MLPSSVFLSTLSLRRATLQQRLPPTWQPYFYPRSPCGERPVIDRNLLTNFNFYPRSPCGERRSTVSVGDVGTDFYPRSPCGERLLAVPGEVVCEVISIHALLAESDPRQCVVGLGYFISIHALLAESDCGLWALYWRHTRFLSTLSLRRAT